ncbi:hypothetical protein FB567DRAFT_599531 [Paraphoma chrysanthemicola]|uniref:Uncharacterized protein n=1 Tax=Paraphoma chrysanthemicola TaxID=798071 RepID=A0A8K0QRW5_9PLEO|nr:hypothetical protein FB567DRAFT_599531 [Paraphoma chrysanthemicola]
MRTSTLSTLVATASIASARIIGFSAPPVLTPSTPFTFNLTTENYIQTVADIAVVWGFQLPTASAPTGYPDSLGAFANSSYLGPTKSDVLGDVTVDAYAPGDLSSSTWNGKDVVLTVAVTSLYGASAGPVTQSWNATVKIGEGSGGDWVVSEGQGWYQSSSC